MQWPIPLTHNPPTARLFDLVKLVCDYRNKLSVTVLMHNKGYSMITECKYCSKTFTAKTYRKIFCSDRCKVAYNRQNSKTCFYCGDLANTKDHITPHSTMGLRRRVWAGIDYVMCCKECNSLMGAAHPYVLSDRIEFLCDKFTKRHKLDKRRRQWDEEELSELGIDLGNYIRNEARIWNKNQQRLDHMRLRLVQVRHQEMESENRTEEPDDEM